VLAALILTSVRVTEQHGVTGFQGFPLDSVNDLGVVGAGDIGDEHPDGSGLSLDEAAGYAVGTVGEFLHCAHDPHAGGLIHPVGRLTEDPGHGGDGNPGPLGYVLYGGTLPTLLCPPSHD